MTPPRQVAIEHGHATGDDVAAVVLAVLLRPGPARSAPKEPGFRRSVVPLSRRVVRPQPELVPTGLWSRSAARGAASGERPLHTTSLATSAIAMTEWSTWRRRPGPRAA